MMTILPDEQTTAIGSRQDLKPSVICVLGMHRSGTSLLTGVLKLLGVYLGDEHRLAEPDDYNPKGYWEHNEIISINDEILTRFGGTWDEPPTFPSSWETAPRIDDLKKRALTLIQSDFVKADIWGWKDPRTCLTMPFWQELLPEIRYVVCLRNPVDVVYSLGSRNNFSAEKGSRLWLNYVNHALQNSEGRPRLISFYEDFLVDWQRELRRVADFIGKTEEAEQPDVRDAVRQFIEQDLQHFQTSIVNTAANQRIARRARAVYVAQRINVGFSGENGSQNGLDEQIEKALKILSYEFKASGEGHSRPGQTDRDGNLADRQKTIRVAAEVVKRGNGRETTSALLDEREQTLMVLYSQLADQDGALQTLSRKLAQRELQMAEHEKKIDQLSTQLQHSETQLEGIRKTLGWRLLNQYGRIKYAILMPIFRLFRQS